MPEAKRPDPKRRSPASRPGKPGKAGESNRPRASQPRRRAAESRPAQAEPAAEETVTKAIAVQAQQQAELQSEQRFGSTARRAAILAAVVCVLTLTIAGPVRTYFAQRTEMKQLKRVRSSCGLRSPTWNSRRSNWPIPSTSRPRPENGSVSSCPVTRPIRCNCRPGPWCRMSRASWCRQGPQRLRGSPGTPRCGTRLPMSRTGFPQPSAGLPRRAVLLRVGRRSRRLRQPSPEVPMVDPADIEAVTKQLGREPRGVLEVAYRCPTVNQVWSRPRRGCPMAHRSHAVLPDAPGTHCGRQSAGVLRADAGDDRAPAAG
ncbi:septum formation initiator [Mycolicibacterium fortuitum]|uniref:Septum formation initiator n=1 Tax=Mycolicibacterium fortuitum TaxID=1766 RepID=A0A378UUW2_MYCFO|nr:septum formation initiator [Mycolicibacterium fortuitum]